MDVPEFSSALPYTKVRDFAYHDKHPLHYGMRPAEPENEAPEPKNDEPQDSIIAADEQPHKKEDDIYRKAVALFDFEPENSNEAPLVEGQIVWINYRHGQGWLVAENLENGETGLVPEEYVQVLPENENEWYDAN